MKLGGKYFVVTKQDGASAGAVFEVRDARAQVRWAQWLHHQPLSTLQVSQLRQELSAPPPSVSLLTPDELVTSEAGLPAAIFQSAPPKGLASILAGLAVGEQAARHITALRVLVGLFAGLADELQRLHAARAVHGAIKLDVLYLLGEGESARAMLGGFGLEAAPRLARGGARPTPRADLAALVLLFQSLLERVGVKLTGGALVRWDVLRNCARAGDHPALNSGAALARTLRQLLDDEEATHRAKTAVSKTPTAAPASDTSAPVPAQPAPQPAPRRRALAIGGGVALALVGAAAVALRGGAPGGPGAGRSSTSTRAAQCGEEPMRPPLGVDVTGEVTALLAVCRGGRRLGVVARGADALLLAERPAERGRGFDGAPAALGEGAAAASTLEGEQGLWVAWRNGGTRSHSHGFHVFCPSVF